MYLQCFCCHSNKVAGVRDRDGETGVSFMSYACCWGGVLPPHTGSFSKWTVLNV